MNHFPFFPKKFRDDEVGERVEHFLRPGLLLACERSLERLREKGASAKELRVQEGRVQTTRSEIAGAELSAAGPKSSAGNVVLPGPRPCDERWQAARHSTLFPEAAESKKASHRNARFGGSKTGSEVPPRSEAQGRRLREPVRRSQLSGPV